MIVIAEFYARYRSTIAETELRTVGERLLQFAENVAREHYAERYNEFGIKVSVRLEIGSSRVWITVKAVGKALITYAAIRQGVDYLVADSKDLARKLAPGISTVLKIDERPLYHQRRLGVPGQVRQLFVQVQRGELSPDEATTRAIDLIQRQDETLMKEIPDFKDRLLSGFREVPEASYKNVRKEELVESIDSTLFPKVPEDPPFLPTRRDPVIATPPGSESRRRRRKGVIVERDPETQSIKVIPY